MTLTETLLTAILVVNIFQAYVEDPDIRRGIRDWFVKARKRLGRVG